MNSIIKAIVLSGIILFTNCQSDFENIHVERNSIDKSALITFNKDLNYINGMELLQKDSGVHLINLTKKNQLVDFNLTDGSYTAVEIPIDSHEVLGVNYGQEDVVVLTEDSVFQFSYTGALLSSYPSPIVKGKYAVFQPYNKMIGRHDSLLYLQIGDENKAPNFVDDKVLLFFNQDTAFSKFDYPAIYTEQYLQYRGICFAKRKNDFYFIPTLGRELYKIDFAESMKKEIITEQEGFLSFDSTKYNDVLYIDTYTDQTASNVKLLVNEENLFLIQKLPQDEPGHYTYKCKIYSHDLDLVQVFRISEKIARNFIGVSSAGLLFLNLSQSQVILCTKKAS